MNRATKDIAKMKHHKLMIMTMVWIFFASFPCDSAHAQGSVDQKSAEHYNTPKDIKKYFHDKYKEQVDCGQFCWSSSTLQETPHGPRGHFWMTCQIKLKNIILSGDKSSRVRAIAMAFLKEEAEVFGLHDLNELQEDKIETGTAYSRLVFTRYINDWPLLPDGLLEWTLGHDCSLHTAQVSIKIGPDESITEFEGYFLSSPPELYKTGSKKMIAKDEAISIVEQDMKAMAANPKEKIISSVAKYASDKPPYFFWIIYSNNLNIIHYDKQPEYGWIYKIDALTGATVFKWRRPQRVRYPE